MYHASKHKTPPFEGEIKFSKDTGLRKLMRAYRRNKVPDERQVIIDTAMKNAAERLAKEDAYKSGAFV